MSDIETSVVAHYGGGDIDRRIVEALEAAGVDTKTLTAADLEAVDQFHIGGTEATTVLLDKMELSPDDTLLDIGCGIGGPARFTAVHTGAHVTGIDLTENFVTAATRLSEKTGLADRTRFVRGSALSMPFGDQSFDAAMMLHVGMNVADKAALFREVARVLKSGGTFAVYDIMRTAPGEFGFPMPWAAGEETSFVETAADYLSAAATNGFEIIAQRELGATAVNQFAAARDRAAEARRTGKPAPPGLDLVMTDRRTKMGNLAAAVEHGILAPIEIVLRLSGGTDHG